MGSEHRKVSFREESWKCSVLCACLDCAQKIVHILFPGILMGEREQCQVVSIIEQLPRRGKKVIYH